MTAWAAQGGDPSHEWGMGRPQLEAVRASRPTRPLLPQAGMVPPMWSQESGSALVPRSRMPLPIPDVVPAWRAGHSKQQSGPGSSELRRHSLRTAEHSYGRRNQVHRDVAIHQAVREGKKRMLLFSRPSAKRYASFITLVLPIRAKFYAILCNL